MNVDDLELQVQDLAQRQLEQPDFKPPNFWINDDLLYLPSNSLSICML